MHEPTPEASVEPDAAAGTEADGRPETAAGSGASGWPETAATTGTPEGPGTPAAPGEPEAPDGPAAPRPLGIASDPTGEPAVDGPLRRLADADHLAVGAHLAVYEDVHRGLRDALAALDRDPGPPAHGTTKNDHRS